MAVETSAGPQITLKAGSTLCRLGGRESGNLLPSNRILNEGGAETGIECASCLKLGKIDSICEDIEEIPISGSEVAYRTNSANPLIAVCGMHRSGTSAAAGTLALLGIRTTFKDDLIPGDKNNRTGYFESRLLCLVNDSVLDVLGGSWSSPPDGMGVSWHTKCDQHLTATGRNPARFKLALQTALAAVTDGESAELWKDPRLSLLLSGWRSIVPRLILPVVVFRDPIETARSLYRRDGMPIEQGIALWEFYNRHLIEQVEPGKALFCNYSEMVTEPDWWITQAASFLSRYGIPVPRELPSKEVRAFLTPEIHADARVEVATSEIAHRAYEIYGLLESLRLSATW